MPHVRPYLFVKILIGVFSVVFAVYIALSLVTSPRVIDCQALGSQPAPQHTVCLEGD
jgi:hypothetical protein